MWCWKPWLHESLWCLAWWCEVWSEFGETRPGMGSRRAYLILHSNAQVRINTCLGTWFRRSSSPASWRGIGLNRNSEHASTSRLGLSLAASDNWDRSRDMNGGSPARQRAQAQNRSL